MRINQKQQSTRIPDPFDSSAQARLMRMGVLDKDGQINEEALKVFAGIFAGLLYDDLVDFYDDRQAVLTVYNTFHELYEMNSIQQMFLLISLQYDRIRKPLPDPIWWLAGNRAAVREFMTVFMNCMELFMSETETSEGDTPK